MIEEEPRLVDGSFVAGLRDTAKVFVTITPVADAPRPQPDAFAGTEDEAFTGSVLANDVDPDGDALTAVLASGPTRGTLDLRSDGTFDLSLPADSFGVASFTYTPRDATGLVGEEVAVVVTFANTPDLARPQADAYTAPEDASLVVPTPGVLSNDTDVDGLGLRAIASRFPRNGTLELALDGSFTYTPVADFAGADTIRYRAINSVGRGVEAEVVLTITPQPDAPIAASDAYGAAEDAELVIAASDGVLTNDTDVDGDVLVATLLEAPRWGEVDLSAGGGFTFTPARDSSGVVTFTYSASDGALSDTATVTLTVAPQPDAPVAFADAFLTDEDVVLTVDASGGVLSNDMDVDGDVLVATLLEAPRWGEVDLSADGGFTFTPARDSSGVVTFTYAASDGALSDTATVTLTITPQLDAPVALADRYTLEEDAALTIAPSGGVLANDTDADGDALVAALVESPRWGEVDLSADGGFTFTPARDSSGVVTFTYAASDGALSDTATVTLTVAPQPDSPVALVDTLDAVQGIAFALPVAGVLSNDTDADGDPLTAQLVSDVSNGSLDFSPDGSLVYTSDTRFIGDDAFVYRATDGTLFSEEVEVVIRVAANPNLALLALDDAYAIGEDSTLTVAAPGILANDADGNGDALSATLVAPPDPLAGTVTLATDGGFVFVPSADFFGEASFVYRASDASGVSDTARVVLTVRPTDDAPRAVADTLEAAEDTPLVVAAPGVLGNDVDPEGRPLTAQLARAARFGSATVDADGGVRYEPLADFAGVDTFAYVASDGALTSDTTLVFVNVGARPDAPTAQTVAFEVAEDDTLDAAAPGVLAGASDPDGDALVALVVSTPRSGTLDLNADGSFRYVPLADFAGADTFAFRVRDADSLFSSPTTATITVAPTPDAPLAVDASYRLDEDAALTLPVPGVLDGDTDADGDPLEALLVTPPTRGVATLTRDGALVYTPAADFSGLDSLRYAATDGALSDTATVRFEVLPSGDAPFAADTSFVGAEDEPLVVAAPGVLAGDADADGDVLAATLVESPRWGTLDLSADGGFTFTPAPDSSGVVTFRYAASDGLLADTATVTLSIAPVNDAPIARDRRYTAVEDSVLTVDESDGVLAGVTDADGDALTASVVESPRWGVLDLSADGGFTFTPLPDSVGLVTFRYAASDGIRSDTATVRIDVDGSNDAPIALDDALSSSEDTVLDVLLAETVLSNDRDSDGDALSVSLVDQPAMGTVALANGRLIYTPDRDSSGVVTFRYAASDGLLADTATVTLTIAPVNDAPIANDDQAFVQLAASVTVDVLSNDSDVEGDALTLVSAAARSDGQAAVESGRVRFTPAPSAEGSVDIDYVIQDANGAQASGVLRVTVITSVYTATDLGTLGGEGARAFAIDDQGRVVGVAQDEQGVVRPFVWQGGTMTFLGAQQGQAYAVDGSAVVGVTTQGGNAFAAQWNTNAPASPPTLLSTRFSQAYDVAGTFVVGTALDGSRLRAARWQSGGEELLQTPGTASSQALGVEPSGRAVGSVAQADGQRGALWSREGALRLLESGTALAINAQGTAVGASGGHAALWRDGVRMLLDSSEVQTEALRINDAGTIVGGRVGAVSGKTVHPVLDPAYDPMSRLRALGKTGAQQITGAFVWERGYVTDLNATLRDSDGVDLIEARDVNSAGQIVGYALIDGVPRAYLLQPASNRAPTAQADVYTAFPDRDMTFVPTANDADADGDSLFVLAVDPPQNGEAWIMEDGSLGYRIASGSEVATDAFDYVVGDGKGGSARATIHLRVESFPNAVRIDGAWPNPFADRTSIRFAIPDERDVRLDLFDTLGRQVATLADRTFEAGVHHVPLDASRLGAGVYFCRVQAGDTVVSIAITRVR